MPSIPASLPVPPRPCAAFLSLLGEPDGPPLLPPIAVTDEVTALVGAFATLAALRHAEKSGGRGGWSMSAC